MHRTNEDMTLLRERRRSPYVSWYHKSCFTIFELKWNKRHKFNSLKRRKWAQTRSLLENTQSTWAKRSMESRLRNALRELSKRYVYRKFAIDRTARNTKFMRARVKSKKKGFNRFHALRIYKREQLNDTNTYNSYTFDVRVSEFACFLCLFGVHVRYICTTLQMMRKALCLSLYDEGHFKVGFTPLHPLSLSLIYILYK